MLRAVAGLLLCASLTACSEQVLVRERALADGPGFSAYLVSYRSDGLKLHAMVAVPEQSLPEAGFPVVIANHGYVPDPTRYGITAEGVDSRPGDYYRSVPELFASRGFLVVLPDYRGHNNSEGLEFTQKADAIDFYARDVVALMAGLHEIPNADMQNVFMWSHSMGGPVSLRALLETDIVKGASFWATSSLGDIRSRLDELSVPLMIQHAIGDTSTDSTNSDELAASLDQGSQAYEFHTYEGSDHYFEGEDRELAADRDAAFFGSLMAQ
jgi:dienelactone hydrolase